MANLIAYHEILLGTTIGEAVCEIVHDDDVVNSRSEQEESNDIPSLPHSHWLVDAPRSVLYQSEPDLPPTPVPSPQKPCSLHISNQEQDVRKARGMPGLANNFHLILNFSSNDKKQICRISCN